MNFYDQHIFNELKQYAEGDESKNNNISIIINYLNACDDNPNVDIEHYISKHPIYKPSQERKIIKAYLYSTSEAGYIQPIGKNKFLEKFLEKNQIQRCVQRTSMTWTVKGLYYHILKTYQCRIAKESIRKSLTKLNIEFQDIDSRSNIYKSFIEKKINDCIKNNIPIYVLKIIKLNEKKYVKHGYIHAKKNRLIIFLYTIHGEPIYSKKPFANFAINMNTTDIDLQKYLDIPLNEGMFLLNSTKYTRQALRNYNSTRYNNRDRFIHNNIYLLEGSMRKKIPILSKIDTIYYHLTCDFCKTYTSKEDNIYDILRDNEPFNKYFK